MSINRKIIETVIGQDTTDGDGVRLKRILSLPQTKKFDPFLMLDSFENRSSITGPGFPWHPHRGIVTITLMIKGEIKHEDSLGNVGVVGPGGVQWMNSGSGIIHQEMPKPGDEGIEGFQLWLNLPSFLKMSDPAYGDSENEEFPVVKLSDGVSAKIIAGNLMEEAGLLQFEKTEPEIYEIVLDSESSAVIPTDIKKNFFLVGIDGVAFIENIVVENKAASLLSTGEQIAISTNDKGARLLLIGGVKLEEPIAWQGPIVMNSSEELEKAFSELRKEEFVKVR
jgi:redox-sensitive bicupin YhaK (pirin superfamily)